MADANDRHDCINPYTSRSRLWLGYLLLGGGLGGAIPSSLWLKCSVGKTAQHSIDWQRPEEEQPLCGNRRHEQKRACGHGEHDQRQDFHRLRS